MIDIAFVNETKYDVSHYEEIITKVFEQTIKTENIDKFYEVSVVFVSREKIQEINREYRNIDSVTDVISFALLEEVEEENTILDDSIVSTLGDIFICIERALEQATEYGHSNDREMGFLACHGLLHLLGYDHIVTDEEVIMFSKQDEILNSINLRR